MNALSSGWRRVLITGYALLTVAMGLWLVVAAFGSDGSPVTAVAQAAFWLALAVALFQNHQKAPTLLWVLVVLSGLGTLLRGLRPIEIMAWGLNLWFTIWYNRSVKPRASQSATPAKAA